MKIKKQSIVNLALTILCGILFLVGCMVSRETDVRRVSASTTPNYTLTVSGTQSGGTWGGGGSSGVTNVTSLSVLKSNNTYDTVKFYLSGSTKSGTATLESDAYITFSDVNISTSVSDCTITLYNSSEQVVTSGKTISTTLSDGRYKARFVISRSGGSGYTMWSSGVDVYTYFFVDVNTPTISGASTSTTYYKTSAFTVTAGDSGSGLENLYVKTPTGSGYTAVGSSKTVNGSDSNGLYCFYAKDKAGNQSKTYYVYLDSTKPTGVIKNASGSTLTGEYTNGTFSYTASDGESGVSYLQSMQPNSSSWSTYTSGTQIQTTATNGKYQFRTVDKAGNVSNTTSIILDSVSPVGVLYSGATAVSTGTKSTASYIKYVASDAVSGIKTVYVKKPNTSEYTVYSNGEPMTGNGTYSFYCVDNANNQSAVVTIDLDNQLPTLSLSTGSWGETLSGNFTVSATDNIGGVKLYYKTPNGSFVESTSTSVTIAKTQPDGAYEFYAADGYGNTTEIYFVNLFIAAPKAQVQRKMQGNQARIFWNESNVTGKLNGVSYTSGTWIKEERDHTLVLTNDANRSTTYTFTITHYYKKKTVVSPTCTTQGYTVFECDNCKDTYNGNYVAELGHTYIVTRVVESTCTSEGYSIYVCSSCGDSRNDDVVSANGHDYGNWYIVVDSTCTEVGIQRRDCVSCGSYEMEEIPEKGHAYTTLVTPPTCLAQGYTTHACVRCTDSYVDTYMDMLGHNYEATVTPPTCTERGYITQKCSRCGDSYVEDYIEANGHNYGAWRIVVEPTCIESGSRYKACTVCDGKYAEVIPALGHDYRTEVAEPTCVDNGYTTHICSRCGTGYNDTFVDALGHDYQMIRVEPTCVEEGYIGQCCTRCGDTYKTQMLKANGHEYVETYVHVACEEEGYVLHSCLICGYEYKTDVIKPSGHSLETKVLLSATCETMGERYYGCTNCDYEWIDEIPAKGHHYELAEEKQTGDVIIRLYICTTCTHSYQQDVGAQYEEVSSYVEYLFEEYSPYMVWVFLATSGVWSVAMGIAMIIAHKNEDKIKAKKMLANYLIGLVIIFGILVAVPFLVRGIAFLVT